MSHDQLARDVCVACIDQPDGLVQDCSIATALAVLH